MKLFPTSKVFEGFLVALTLSVAGCGANNGSPDPTKRPSDSADLASCNNPTNLIADTLTSQGGNWKVDYSWQIGPSMNEDEQIENKLALSFKTYTGIVPTSLTNVQVTAWMPEHKHGTGNELPKTNFDVGGKAIIDNIWFTMSGKWEMILKAAVNDVADEVRFCVNVRG